MTAEQTPPPIEVWFDTYPAMYSRLFDDGRTTQAALEADHDTVALTALLRYSIGTSYYMPRFVKVVDAQVVQAVGVTLDACLEGLFGDDIVQTFGAAREHLRETKSVVSSTIIRWEHACYRAKKASPFEDVMIEDSLPDDFRREGTQAILMVTAGLLALKAAGHKGHVKRGGKSGLLYYGPRFTRDFLANRKPQAMPQ